ncbi:DUF5719 family protein [Arcanobacterium buesumense]|uniref:Secreted protein n=1 Tax=Arcanobacterium buesumense TaxID=2722751 RepID=A0A6H2EMP5_9ACTO|nr:DUF5719 family protein [Arcanobacterium buesumense]QJC22341.1 hypothetical protein HC352_07335 [Arcanobacterium buesumense]
MRIKPIVSGIAVLALASAVGVIAVSLPAPAEMAAKSTEYVPTDQTFSLACLGGAIRTVAEGVNVTNEAESITGHGVVFVDGAHWFDILTQTDRDSTTVVPTAVSELGVTDATGVVYATNAQVQDGHITGASTVQVGGGDMRGLATNPCQWTRQTQWLVGSQSGVGTYNVLSLLNPGDNPITVYLRAFGPNGPVEVRQRQQISVAARTKITVNLDGLLDDTSQLALELSSDSGAFGASMQTNVLSGFTPQGLSFIGHAALGREVFIPGFEVSEPQGSAVKSDVQSSAEGGESPENSSDPGQTTATLRLVNPHENDTTVHVDLIGDKEYPLPGADNLVIPAQSVLDLTLDGIDPGAYTVRVRADEPVTAAINMSLTYGALTDTTWIGAQTPIQAGGAALNGSSTLMMNVPSSTAVTVTGYDIHGKEQYRKVETVTHTAALTLPDDLEFVWISATNPVAAAVYSTADLNTGRGINVIGLTAQGADAQAMRVSVNP